MARNTLPTTNDDQPHEALTAGAIVRLAKDAVSAWVEDFAPSMGAAISYYTVFSIAPLLLIVIALTGFFLGHDAASGKIFAELEGLLGADGAAAIQGMVKSASSPAKSTLGTVVGVVILLIGATTVFAEIQSALDRIWREPAPSTEGIWQLVRSRFLSFGLILTIGFLLLVSLVVSAGISFLGTLWAPAFGGWEVMLQVTNVVASVGIMSAAFGAIYKLLPRAKIAWRDVWTGALVTAVLFTIGKSLIGLYIGKSGVTSGFGAAGSLVVVLIWVYYSSQIFLLGAEFTWLFAHRFGSRKFDVPEQLPPSNASTNTPRGHPPTHAAPAAAVREAPAPQPESYRATVRPSESRGDPGRVAAALFGGLALGAIVGHLGTRVTARRRPRGD